MKKLLLILLCCPLIYSCHSQNKEANSSTSELTEICENINSVCPMMVNETFEFTSISCKYPVVELTYRYTTYESEGELMNEVMKKVVMKEVEEPINNNEGFKDFREAGYTFLSKYVDKNYSQMFHFIVQEDVNGIYKIVDTEE
jgi:hypothetical protein